MEAAHRRHAQCSICLFSTCAQWCPVVVGRGCCPGGGRGRKGGCYRQVVGGAGRRRNQCSRTQGSEVVGQGACVLVQGEVAAALRARVRPPACGPRRRW